MRYMLVMLLALTISVATTVSAAFAVGEHGGAPLDRLHINDRGAEMMTTSSDGF